MRSIRLACGLAAVAAVALVVALPADGKEGARSTLTSHVPVRAAAGTTFRIAWIVTIRDHGRNRLFGGGGMFVRLVSRVSGQSTRVDARGLYGRYSAIVRVPKGGMRGIELGLRSWVSDPGGTREGEWLFPITNSPFSRKNR